MARHEPTQHHLREALLVYYKQGKTAADGYCLLSETYLGQVLSEKSCRKWFARFKSGNLNVADKERPGKSRKFDDKDLLALLDQNPCISQDVLAETLGVDRSTICIRLKALGISQKDGQWVRDKQKYPVDGRE